MKSASLDFKFTPQQVCIYAMLRGEGSAALYLIGSAFRTGAALPVQARLTKLNLVVILLDIIK
jgi:hypothetical protein